MYNANQQSGQYMGYQLPQSPTSFSQTQYGNMNQFGQPYSPMGSQNGS